MQSEMYKKCAKCEVVQLRTAFSKCNQRKDGLQTKCKECNRRYHAENRVDSPEFRAWREQHYAKKRDEILAANRAWAKANPARTAERGRLRMRRIARQTPQWSDRKIIAFFYATRIWITNETGDEWHVDHVLPLSGKKVSGLHVPLNLQVIPAVENFKKNNRFTPG